MICFAHAAAVTVVVVVVVVVWMSQNISNSNCIGRKQEMFTLYMKWTYEDGGGRFFVYVEMIVCVRACM